LVGALRSGYRVECEEQAIQGKAGRNEGG
jgi:hypothetical protein